MIADSRSKPFYAHLLLGCALITLSLACDGNQSASDKPEQPTLPAGIAAPDGTSPQEPDSSDAKAPPPGDKVPPEVDGDIVFLQVEKQKLAPLWTRLIKGKWLRNQPPPEDEVVLLRQGNTCIALDAKSGKQLWTYSCGDARFQGSVRTGFGKAYVFKHREVRFPKSGWFPGGPENADARVEKPLLPPKPELQIIEIRTGKVTDTLVIERPEGAEDPSQLTDAHGEPGMQWEIDGDRVYVEWLTKYLGKNGRIARVGSLVSAYKPAAAANPYWRFEPEEEKGVEAPTNCRVATL